MLFYLLRNIRQPCRSYCTNSKSHPKPPTSPSEQPAHPRSFLAGIINLLTCEPDPGIQADAASCLTELFHDKDLFFTANPAEKEARQLTPEQLQDKEDCMALLYDSYMTWIVQPFQDSATSPGRPGWLLPASFCLLRSALTFVLTVAFVRCCGAGANNAMVHLVEFLSSCVLNHGYRAKYFILQNHLIEAIVQLCARKEKILQIGLAIAV